MNNGGDFVQLYHETDGNGKMETGSLCADGGPSFKKSVLMRV